MNPLLDPRIAISFLKNWIVDPGRMERKNPKQLQHYKDKVFKKIVKYAYTIPVYYDKYKKSGIRPNDINGIKDITKLPFISREDMLKDGIKKTNELSNIMKEADFISLHLPHIPSTHHIINEKMLSKMKTTAYLINCSRGGIVDENALYNALKDEKIAGAGIDVFENEPPKDSPLLLLDNVILTPHLGANTKEGQIRAGTVCAEQVIKCLNDEIPDFWVNNKLM